MRELILQFSSVQSLSHIWLFATPWTAARHASLSIINSRTLFRLTSIESVMPSSHLILCRPLLLLPPIPPSIRVFSNETVLRIRWPKYWSCRFSIRPSNEYSGLISFRMDWFDLLAVQGTLKSLLQRHSSKASILQCSALFMVQLSHPYMTTGKTIALTRRIFEDKVMPLLFNMLSRLVPAFLPRSKCLNFMAAITICSDLGVQKIKSGMGYSLWVCKESDMIEWLSTRACTWRWHQITQVRIHFCKISPALLPIPVTSPVISSLLLTDQHTDQTVGWL